MQDVSEEAILLKKEFDEKNDFGITLETCEKICELVRCFGISTFELAQEILKNMNEL